MILTAHGTGTRVAHETSRLAAEGPLLGLEQLIQHPDASAVMNYEFPI